MPNNRSKREQAVHDTYNFVVFGGEYSVAHALLAVADGIITGGNFTYQFLKDEVKQFGINLAVAMANAGINPLNEALYFDKMVFENWETPVAGMKVPLPNKFVPYVAARKKPDAPTYIPLLLDQHFGAMNDGNGVFYRLNLGGQLMWYKHTGWQSGAAIWVHSHGTLVGTGWSSFTNIIPGGNGVLYGVAPDGRLMWYKHTGWQTGAATWVHDHGTEVGTGWNSFTNIVPGGGGVLYGVAPDGRLMWYKHTGWQTGAATWVYDHGTEVGTGWNSFTNIVPGGSGVLYGVAPDGRLMWYKHTGWQTGAATWVHDHGIEVGTGWASA
jgi:hypothetical protein